MMATRSIPLRLLLVAIGCHSASTLRADAPIVLANQVLDSQWTLDAGRITAFTLTNKHTDQTLRYISPHLLTPAMWDELAAAAKWSRANSDVLVDTHWIGGDPGVGDIYGWASWHHAYQDVSVRLRRDEPKQGLNRLHPSFTRGVAAIR